MYKTRHINIKLYKSILCHVKQCKCKTIENIWFLIRGDFVMFLKIGHLNGPWKKNIKAFVLWDALQPIKLINMNLLVIKGI
jgi:hypothetical protein